MFENALQKDGESFIKNKQISAKRPSEYWLLFIKQYVLSYKKPMLQPWMLMFLLPVIVLIVLLLIGPDTEIIMVGTGISIFISIVIGSIWRYNSSIAFVPVEEFHDLAKFIISIKGDIHRNLINLRLNAGVIEDKLNLLDPYKIGLTKSRGVKYAPYELERFKAVFYLKDASVCTVSLHQIALRVTTTKRRSSGKTKTKMKRKHKYFHALTLKLNASQYDILNQDQTNAVVSDLYDIRVKTDGGFHYVKVKSKQKLLTIPSVIKKMETHKDSIYTEMMQYVSHLKIVTSSGSQKLIQ
jgi:hypothetical protein